MIIETFRKIDLTLSIDSVTINVMKTARFYSTPQHITIEDGKAVVYPVMTTVFFAASTFSYFYYFSWETITRFGVLWVGKSS